MYLSLIHILHLDYVEVPQDGRLANNQAEGIRCGDNGIFKGVPVTELTAGLPVNLEGLVGANGEVFGLESFGFSAPYKVLDEKLGFTAQNVIVYIAKP